MLKWITAHPTERRWLRWLTLPDPETLVRLSDSHARFNNSDVALEFSRIVSTIWIDEVNKRTHPNRLPSTLESLLRHWRPSPDRRSLTFLDLGASDGLNTREAAQFVRTEYQREVHAIALDKYLTLHCHGWRWLREYRAANEAPVLLRCGPFGMRLGRRLAFWPIEILRRLYLSRASLRGAMPRRLSIPLIHPQALLDRDLCFREADILNLDSDTLSVIDVVRASNVLNLSYFSADDIARALQRIHALLRPDGMLIVSRNVIAKDGEFEQGTLWRRLESGFKVLHEFGGGSEIAPLVNALCAHRSDHNATQPQCRPPQASEQELQAA
jgi:SAM-dependent methyltransferase